MSSTGKCLANVPSTLLTDPFAVFTNESLPGLFYSADDQCKAKYDSGASFCQVV